MPYSNDPIEGANTKVKLLKRQMHGGGRFPVLRQQILLINRRRHLVRATADVLTGPAA